MVINFQGLFTKKELIQAYKYHYLPTKLSKYFRIVIASLTIISFGLYSLLVYPERTLSDFGVIIPLIFILLLVFYPFFLPRINAKRLLKDTEFRFKISGSVNDQGVSIITENSKSEIKWELYLNYQQIDDLILVYQSKLSFNIFPKRFFQTNEDWGAFINYVRDNVPERKVGVGRRSS